MVDVPGEVWVRINGFPEYAISDQGRVMRVAEREWCKVREIGCVGDRYRVVILCTHRAAPSRRFYIHRLVAEHHVPNHNNKPDINHLDGNRSNNKAGNLVWATQSENSLHAYATGLAPRGSKRSDSRLTEDAVREIRKLWGTLSSNELATKFGVTRAAVHSVYKGKTWKHVA